MSGRELQREESSLLRVRPTSYWIRAKCIYYFCRRVLYLHITVLCSVHNGFVGVISKNFSGGNLRGCVTQCRFNMLCGVRGYARIKALNPYPFFFLIYFIKSDMMPDVVDGNIISDPWMYSGFCVKYLNSSKKITTVPVLISSRDGRYS